MIHIDDNITYLPEILDSVDYDRNVLRNQLVKQKVEKLTKIAEDIDTQGKYVMYSITGKVAVGVIIGEFSFIGLANESDNLGRLLSEYWGQI